MKEKEIVETLKTHYTREIRKQLVKTIQEEERSTKPANYTTLNQIFSYVLKELNWDISNTSKEWNQTPLSIMKEAFPHLEETRWYKDQLLLAKKNIDLKQL